MSTPAIGIFIVLVLVGVILYFNSRKSTTVYEKIKGSKGTVMKTILVLEKKSIVEVAAAIKQDTTLKREETEKRIASTKNKLAEISSKTVSDVNIISREEVIQKRREVDMKIAEMERLHRSQEIQQAIEATRLAEELAEKRRVAEERIRAAKDREETMRRARDLRAAEYREKIMQFNAKKILQAELAAEAKRKAEIATKLEKIRKRRAVELAAKLEMDIMLEKQRVVRGEIDKASALATEQAREEQKLLIQQAELAAEEAKIIHENLQKSMVEAENALAEEVNKQKLVVEEARLEDESRLAEIEETRIEAEAASADLLKEEELRQTQMDEDVVKLRDQQDVELERLETERSSIDKIAQSGFAANQRVEDELAVQLEIDEAKFLSDEADEAQAANILFIATQDADQAEQDRLLSVAADASADSAQALVDDTDGIQTRADLALSLAKEQEGVKSGGVETEEEFRARLENGSILDTFKVTCNTRATVSV
tara:strand:+ start:254 stop:1711 length:1458 start_codon:yes stop_codon:yes gene_type:complete